MKRHVDGSFGCIDPAYGAAVKLSSKPARSGAETARHMLIRAFAGEIIERIRHAPARKEMDELVWERLEANPHLAQNK